MLAICLAAAQSEIAEREQLLLASHNLQGHVPYSQNAIFCKIHLFAATIFSLFKSLLEPLLVNSFR
jgi:hypothetical protein